jgi:hypothetical protein
VAVNNKQPVRSSRGRLCISVKVLKLCQREVVVNPASRRNSNNPIARYICKLGGNKDLARKDKEG